METKPLAGKTALVTGAARNIGRAIALTLADAGANIIVNALQDQAAADAVAAELTEAGTDCIVCMADVTDRDAVFAMAEAGREKFGSVDILISNASARGMVDFLDIKYEDWRRVIDISLDGAFHCAQATLPMMVERGWGRIVSLSGFAWHTGIPRRAHSLTGKAGLTGFARALAVEFGDRGITSNVICPGAVDTVRPASAGALPPRKNLPPVPRNATVEEIASATRFLCMPEQAYLTGQIIHVNGGAYLGT